MSTEKRGEVSESENWWSESVLPGYGGRLKEIRERVLGMPTRHEFADSFGFTAAKIGHYETENARLPQELIARLATVLTEHGNADELLWLLTGRREKEMRLDAPMEDWPGHFESERFVCVPEYSVTAGLGEEREVAEEDIVGELPIARSWLERQRLNPTRLAAISARGDSMEPTIKSGDVLLVDRTVEQVRDDDIYVVRVDGALLVKRLQKQPGRLRVTSDNRLFEGWDVTDEMAEAFIRVIGRVVWIGRTL